MSSYLSRIPSASIVNKMENLRRTVNIGRLVEEDRCCFNISSSLTFNCDGRYGRKGDSGPLLFYQLQVGQKGNQFVGLSDISP